MTPTVTPQYQAWIEDVIKSLYKAGLIIDDHPIYRHNLQAQLAELQDSLIAQELLPEWLLPND